MSARLVALVVAFAVIGPAAQALAGVAHGSAAWAGETQLGITGTAPALIPGHPVTVKVRISNPTKSRAAVRVVQLTAKASDASAACTAGNVVVSSYRWTPSGRTYAPSPGTSVVVPLTMTLVETGANQDACQGVLFPVGFSVGATTV